MKDDDRAAKDGKRPSRARIDRGVQERIGQQLRAMYDHVASEPVPDRLLQLLEELEQADTPKSE